MQFNQRVTISTSDGRKPAVLVRLALVSVMAVLLLSSPAFAGRPGFPPEVFPDGRFPTFFPTLQPTPFPTFIPTFIGTKTPTPFPTFVPTFIATNTPTPVPTFVPTGLPTIFPTVFPTRTPRPPHFCMDHDDCPSGQFCGPASAATSGFGPIIELGFCTDLPPDACLSHDDCDEDEVCRRIFRFSETSGESPALTNGFLPEIPGPKPLLGACVATPATPEPTEVPTEKPTAEPTEVPTEPANIDPTMTPTMEPTAEFTATPTWTPRPDDAFCLGDCNDNGIVSIAELIRLVNIASGQQDLETCAEMIELEEISISDLIRAVNNSLLGCD